MTVTITTVGWWGAYPDAAAATSSFLLATEGCNILIDCGSGVLSHLQRYLAVENLDAVLLSHYHWDHFADVGCLQYAVRVQMDLGRRRHALAIYGHGESDRLAELTYLSYCRGLAYDPDGVLELAGVRFTFCRNLHPAPCFSIRAEVAGRVLVYITDTGWADQLPAFASGADLLICESSLYDEYRGKIPGHLSAGEAGQVAAKAGARHLVLTHLPHFGDHLHLLAQARRYFSGPIDLAATGRKWQL